MRRPLPAPMAAPTPAFPAAAPSTAPAAAPTAVPTAALVTALCVAAVSGATPILYWAYCWQATSSVWKTSMGLPGAGSTRTFGPVGTTVQALSKPIPNSSTTHLTNMFSLLLHQHTRNGGEGCSPSLCVREGLAEIVKLRAQPPIPNGSLASCTTIRLSITKSDRVSRRDGSSVSKAGQPRQE